MDPVTFMWYDYLLFAGILAVSFVIGLVFTFTGGRQRTTGEYLTADRSLSILPVTLSMYMSFTSGIMVLGNGAEMYTYGVQMWLSTLGTGIAYLIGPMLFLPMFYKLKVTSCFEYLEKRYDSEAVRKMGSVLSIVAGLLYSGLAMYTPATALEAVTPIPMWASIVAMGVIGTLYTTFGGIKAVVWTDAFQGVSMLAGVIAICVIGVNGVGSMKEVWDVCKQNHRLWISFDPNPMVRISFWSVLIGNLIGGISSAGTSQPTVQRFVAMKSVKDAFIASALCFPLHVIFYTLTFIAGGAMFTYYHKEGCDPLRSGQVQNTNQLLSFFVLNGLKKPALPGLITALLVSGALSSVSSSVNSNAAVTWRDFMYDRGPFKKMSERSQAWTTKILSLIYGCCAIGLAFAYRYFPGHGSQVSRSISRSAGSPLFGMFVLAAFFPFTTPVGVMVGAAAGFAAHLTIGLGNSLYNPWPLTLNTTVETCGNLTINDDMLVGNSGVPTFFHMSYHWYEAFGSLVTVGVGLLVSLISKPRKPSRQDPRYMIPFFDRICCCLPVSCRRKFWCGVDYHDDDKYLQDDSSDFHDNEKAGEKIENYKAFDSLGVVYSPDNSEGYMNKINALSDEDTVKHRLDDTDWGSENKNGKSRLTERTWAESNDVTKF